MWKLGYLSLVLLAFGICETRAQTSSGAPATILIGDFESALDPDLSDKYQCQGAFSYVAAPTSTDPANKALYIVLDPSKPPPPNCDGVRGEVSEAISLRLPLRTDVWYGFQFMLPTGMRSKI